jgi:hypothetical protein
MPRWAHRRGAGTVFPWPEWGAAWVKVKWEARGPYPKLHGGWILAVKFGGGEVVLAMVWGRWEVTVKVPWGRAWLPHLRWSSLVLGAMSKRVKVTLFRVVIRGQFVATGKKWTKWHVGLFYSPAWWGVVAFGWESISWWYDGREWGNNGDWLPPSKTEDLNGINSLIRSGEQNTLRKVNGLLLGAPGHRWPGWSKASAARQGAARWWWPVRLERREGEKNQRARPSKGIGLSRAARPRVGKRNRGWFRWVVRGGRRVREG